jgi:glucuronoarabinoxylan endo-1,4-beta-xylanase
MIQQKIFLIIAAFCFVLVSRAQLKGSLSVDAEIKYQKISGFGAVGMYSSTIAGGWQNYITANQIDSLYGPGGIGLNIFRVSVPYSAYAATGNKWFAYCNTAPKMNSMVEAVKRVKSYGGIVLASPWSPPVAFKDTSSKGGWYYGTSAEYDFKTTLSNGTVSYRKYNKLSDARYADYAAFLNSFLNYMSSQQAAVDIISVQNEPDYVYTDAACYWSGSQMLKFVKEQGVALKGNTGVKLMAGETAYFDAKKRNVYTNPILNDPTASDCTDYIAGHIYGDGADLDYTLARNAGKEVWMTEHAFGSSVTREPTWSEELLFATEIHNCLALGNYSAYLSWYPRRFYSFLNDGTYNSSNTGKYTRRAFVMAQFARYLTGKTHVKTILTTSDAKIQASAYINTEADSLVVIVINSSNFTHNLTLSLPFYTNSGYSVVTTPETNLLRGDLTLSESKSPVVSIQAQSINTLVFSKADITSSRNVERDDSLLNFPGDLYRIDGRTEKQKLTSEKDLSGIKPGIYIFNNRKIIVQ